MYGQLDTTGLPTLSTYADCLMRWTRTAKLRGHSDDAPRPLGERKHRTKWLVKYGDDSFACRLHRTDVVTYPKAGGVILKPWASMATDAFANLIVPAGIHCAFNSSLGSLVWLGEGWRDPNIRGYLIGASIWLHRVDGRWCLHPASVKPLPIKSYRANTANMRAAAKASGLDDFLAWERATYALGREQAYKHRYAYVDRVVVETINGIMLPDRTQWEEMLSLAGTSRNSALDRIRKAVYRAYGNCVDVEDLPYLTSYAQEKAVRGRQIAYHYF